MSRIGGPGAALVAFALLAGPSLTTGADSKPGSVARPWAYAENSYVAIDGSVLAVSQPRHHAVLLFDAGRMPPQFLQVVGTQGRAVGQFIRPTGVAIALGQRILAVSDAGNHRVQVFRIEVAGDGRVSRVSFAKSLGRYGQASGELDTPEGLAFDGAGNLYVCDSGNARVQVFDKRLQLVRHFGERGTGNGQMGLPTSIAVGSAGQVYVVDAGNLRVHVFDRDGKWLTAWGRPALPAEPGSFGYPFGLAVARGGDLYVTDSRRQVVQEFKPDGSFVREWGGPGQEPGRFFQTEGVALDAEDRLVVVDFGSHRAQVFSGRGEVLGHFSLPPADLIVPTPPAMTPQL